MPSICLVSLYRSWYAPFVHRSVLQRDDQNVVGGISDMRRSRSGQLRRNQLERVRAEIKPFIQRDFPVVVEDRRTIPRAGDHGYVLRIRDRRFQIFRADAEQAPILGKSRKPVIFGYSDDPRHAVDFAGAAPDGAVAFQRESASVQLLDARQVGIDLRLADARPRDEFAILRQTVTVPVHAGNLRQIELVSDRPHQIVDP